MHGPLSNSPISIQRVCLISKHVVNVNEHLLDGHQSQDKRQKTKDENGKVLWKELSAVMRVKSFRLFMSESTED